MASNYFPVLRMGEEGKGTQRDNTVSRPAHKFCFLGGSPTLQCSENHAVPGIKPATPTSTADAQSIKLSATP